MDGLGNSRAATAEGQAAATALLVPRCTDLLLMDSAPVSLPLLCLPVCLQSLEDEAVRAQVLRLVSLPLWHTLSRGRLQLELHDQPQLAKHWKHLAKKEAKAAAAQEGYVAVQQRAEATFLPGKPACRGGSAAGWHLGGTWACLAHFVSYF